MTTNSDNVDKKIVEQIEHYFKDLSLGKDKYLLDLMEKNDGWVPIAEIAAFKRMVALSQDGARIAAAVRQSKSEAVAVSDDNSKVRRIQPMPEFTHEFWQEANLRSVRMEGFPLVTDIDEILDWAHKITGAVYVDIRGLRQTEDVCSRNIYVTFKTVEEAQTAQQSDIKFANSPLAKVMKEDYFHMKNEEASKAFENVKYEKGLILSVDGLSSDSKIEDIRHFFKTFGPVAFVEHRFGSRTAEIRFSGSHKGGAQKAWDFAVSQGIGNKVIFNGAEITGRVLGGEEEKTCWMRIAERRSRTRKFNEKREEEGKHLPEYVRRLGNAAEKWGQSGSVQRNTDKPEPMHQSSEENNGGAAAK